MKYKKYISMITFILTLQCIVYSSIPEKSQTIDFENRGRRHFGDFHIDLPATWAPGETENTTDSSRTISYTAGNKTQTIDLNINYYAAGSMEHVNRENNTYRKDIILNKITLHFLRSDGYEDATHNAKFYYHLFEDSKKSGFVVTGVLSSKSGDKLAVVKLSVSFPKGSPLAGEATTYLKKSTDIVKSFRIEGL
jgi:hypothetical protein